MLCKTNPQNFKVNYSKVHGVCRNCTPIAQGTLKCSVCSSLTPVIHSIQAPNFEIERLKKLIEKINKEVPSQKDFERVKSFKDSLNFQIRLEVSCLCSICKEVSIITLDKCLHSYCHKCLSLHPEDCHLCSEKIRNFSLATKRPSRPPLENLNSELGLSKKKPQPVEKFKFNLPVKLPKKQVEDYNSQHKSPKIEPTKLEPPKKVVLGQLTRNIACPICHKEVLRPFDQENLTCTSCKNTVCSTCFTKTTYNPFHLIFCSKKSQTFRCEDCSLFYVSTKNCCLVKCKSDQSTLCLGCKRKVNPNHRVSTQYSTLKSYVMFLNLLNVIILKLSY